MLTQIIGSILRGKKRQGIHDVSHNARESDLHKGEDSKLEGRGQPRAKESNTADMFPCLKATSRIYLYFIYHNTSDYRRKRLKIIKVKNHNPFMLEHSEKDR